MTNLTLIQRFSLISLVAIVIFAFSFGKILSNAMERDMIDRAIKDTTDLVFNNVVKHFAKETLLKAKTGSEYDSFTEEIEHLSLGSNIESIEIWNKDKVVATVPDASANRA